MRCFARSGRGAAAGLPAGRAHSIAVADGAGATISGFRTIDAALLHVEDIALAAAR